MESCYEGNPRFDAILAEEIHDMYDESVSNWDTQHGNEEPPSFDDWLDMDDEQWMLDAAYDLACNRFQSEMSKNA